MLSLILFALAASCNAVMDVIQFRPNRNIFPKNNWWVKEESWKNKYVDRDPSKGFKLWGLAEYIVWPFDAWHFFKSIMIYSLVFAIVIHVPLTNKWYWDFIIFRTSFGLFFELYFKFLLVRG